jgi:hypothetical protein
MEKQIDENEFWHEVGIMLDAMKNLPVKSHIQIKRDDDIAVAVYKDPKGRTWWHYKLPQKRFTAMKEITKG